MTIDIVCSSALAAALVGITCMHTAHTWRRGRTQYDRIDKEGSSAMISKGTLEMLYWAAHPIARLLGALGIHPDTITYASLALGIGASLAFAVGHFGLGALVATAAASADALDGLLARLRGTSSAAGEILDAAVDRYVDFAIFAGYIFYFRTQPVYLVVSLFAVSAAFLVSYSSAKAEAMSARVPRGSMRRVERSVLVVVASALSPWLERAGGRGWRDAPIVGACLLIAVVGHACAIQRFAIMRQGVKTK